MLCVFLFFFKYEIMQIVLYLFGYVYFFHKFIKIFYHVTHYQSMHHWLFAA